MSESRTLESAVEFAENSEPRCPCILLLDVSYSMSGAPINALNEGLRIFRDGLNQDGLTKKRVEIAIVTFGSKVKVVQEFVTVDRFWRTDNKSGRSNLHGSWN